MVPNTEQQKTRFGYSRGQNNLRNAADTEHRSHRGLNGQWRRGYPDEQLKQIKVIAIPKAGKDRDQLEGKRPISLVPTCTKIVNTAVLHLLQAKLEERCVLPEKSFGFRKGLSTITCVSYVVNKIKKNKREGLKTAIIFVDLSNAFNTVNGATLEETMPKEQIQPEVISWVTAFLKNRKVTFDTNGEKIHRIVSDGLPQGDVMSPTLFNLYTKTLHKINVEGVELVQFADDFGIIVTSKTVEKLNEAGQTYLTKFADKCETLNLKINANKTKTLLFQLGGKQMDCWINGTLLATVIAQISGRHHGQNAILHWTHQGTTRSERHNKNITKL